MQDFLFIGHAEFMFFIDDDESEIVKFYIRRKEPMRPDDQIHRTISEPLEHDPLLSRRLREPSMSLGRWCYPDRSLRVIHQYRAFRLGISARPRS